MSGSALVLPLTEYAVNHHRHTILGDRSAVEVMTGRHPHTSVYLSIWSGPDLKNTTEIRLPADRANE